MGAVPTMVVSAHTDHSSLQDSHRRTCGLIMATRRHTSSIISAAIFGVFALSACQPTTSPLPRGAVRYDPPAVYARWWAMSEACSGRTGRLDAVRWYQAPGDAVLLDGKAVGGFWSSGGNIIVLPTALIFDGAGVRHEMLHALLHVDGHPRRAFLEQCADIVRCAMSCARAAGPWSAPSAYAIVPPDSIAVTARTSLLPWESDGQRWVVLEISASNDRDRAVLVEAPGETFGYRVTLPDGTGRQAWQVVSDSSAIFFAPRAIKRWRFEFLVTDSVSAFTLPPGTNVVVGAYARHRAAPETVAVAR
jgi:hypothetical protein